MNGQRRKTGIAGVTQVGTDLQQAIDQVADRPFVHARDAGQAIVPARQGQCGGQRPDRGAGISHEQVGILDRKHAVAALDAPCIAAQRRNANADFLQGIEHHERVVGVEQVTDFGRAFGQRGQQQHAVGNAFRTRQADGAGSPRQRGQGQAAHHSPGGARESSQASRRLRAVLNIASRPAASAPASSTRVRISSTM
jgi:hypothetical protein